jgi:GTP-binding protein
MVKIAIVGRPNVGKSTLFNRLAGRRLALVHDRPGVTRDRRVALGRLGDLDLTLIDTAGFEDVRDESLEARMRRQTEQALDEADVALFLIDAREGVTPLDRTFADLIRRRGKPAVLVANKAEGSAGISGAAEGAALGLGEAVAISAEHGEGLADLYEAIEARRLVGNEGGAAEAQPIPLRIAVVGRPNAGKSTLVNRLVGEDRLLTGPEAGITRDAISVDWDWEGRPIRLVDTAGLRRKARVAEALEKLSVQDAIRAITFAEVVILVMDATHSFETQDLQIADLVEREGRALVFVLAKWDLVDDADARLKECRHTAERMLPQLRGAPLIALSAETGRGLERLMPAVVKTHEDWSTKVKTSDLNEWLRLASERHPPPMVSGRRIRLKYVAQTKARPPSFVLFASRAGALPDSYRRYLVNSIRESFDLPGTPIRLTVKSGANPYANRSDDAGAVRAKRPVRRGPSSRATRPSGSAGRGRSARPGPRS